MLPSYKIDKASLPQGLEWLCGLPRGLEKDLASSSKVIVLPPDKLIGQRNEQLNYLVSVLSGRVGIYADTATQKQQRLASKEAGSMIGWLSVIDGNPLDADLITETETKLLLIPVSLAKEILYSCRTLTTQVFGDLTKSLREFAAQKQTLSVPNAQQRVFVHLLSLVNQAAPEPKSAHKIPKQEEIAKQINTSRETVSRALQILVRNGIILKRGHQIEIKNLNGLKKIADAPSESHTVIPVAKDV